MIWVTIRSNSKLGQLRFFCGHQPNDPEGSWVLIFLFHPRNLVTQQCREAFEAIVMLPKFEHTVW